MCIIHRCNLCIDDEVDPHVTGWLPAKHDPVDIGLTNFCDSRGSIESADYYRVRVYAECSCGIETPISILRVKTALICHATNLRCRLPQNIADLLSRKARIIIQQESGDTGGQGRSGRRANEGTG